MNVNHYNNPSLGDVAVNYHTGETGRTHMGYWYTSPAKKHHPNANCMVRLVAIRRPNPFSPFSPSWKFIDADGTICVTHEGRPSRSQRGHSSGLAAGGMDCEDEGCPHYGTPHAHVHDEVQFTSPSGEPVVEATVIMGIHQLRDSIPSPRLSPTGTHYICDTCGRRWLSGDDPGCPECAAKWLRIEAGRVNPEPVRGTSPLDKPSPLPEDGRD